MKNRNILKLFRKIDAVVLLALICFIPTLIGIIITFSGNFHRGDFIFIIGVHGVTLFSIIYLLKNGNFIKTLHWKLFLILFIALIGAFIMQISDIYFAKTIKQSLSILIFTNYLWYFLQTRKFKLKNLLKLIWVALIFLFWLIVPNNKENNLILYFIGALILFFLCCQTEYIRIKTTVANSGLAQ